MEEDWLSLPHTHTHILPSRHSVRLLTSSVTDLMSPMSGVLILNVCVVPGENLKGLVLEFLFSAVVLDLTAALLLLRHFLFIFPLLPFIRRYTLALVPLFF